MGRPLKQDNWWPVGGHWCAAVPAETGSRTRIKRTFFTQADAKQWHGYALAALQAGQPVPEPEDLGLTQPRAGAQPLRPAASMAAPAAPAQPAAASAIPVVTEVDADSTIDEVAWAWHHEYYTLMESAQPGTALAKAADLRNVILPTLHAAGIHEAATVKRSAYIAVRRHFTGIAPLDVVRPTRGPAAHHAPVAVTGEWLSTADAVSAGVTRSTLMRLKDSGALPNTRKVDGRLAFARADLIGVGKLPAEGPSASPQPTVIYAKDTAAEFLRVVDKILDHAADVAGWDLGFDRNKVPRGKSRASKRPARRQITLTETLAVMTHLHAIHQCALLLMRVMGLRISEAYGVRLEHLIDLGEEGGGRGLLRVRAQGGTPMLTREKETGQYLRVEAKDSLKTEASYRTLVVPAAVMEVLRQIIATFHTMPDGTIDPHARLIPGLTRADAAGQDAFRPALSKAASIESINLGEDIDTVLLPRPHDLRKGAITDLAWTAEMTELARKRFAGHITGNDVHNLVYVLDDPELAPMREAADALDTRLAQQAPDGLLVPTSVRCTTSGHQAHRARAKNIDADLTNCGWLIPPAGQIRDGEELLDSVAVAKAFDVERVTAARWMATGVLPATKTILGGRERHLATRSDVEALAAQLSAGYTCDELAEELSVPYQRVYQLWRNHGLEGALVRGRRLLTPETVETIRTIITAAATRDARSMPLADAAEALARSVYAVKGLADGGELTYDPLTGVNGARYLTRDSVAAYLAEHPPIRVRRRRNKAGRRRDQ